jgi:hypothetical protein
MLWVNNPEVLRELHKERIRQLQTVRRPRLKLIAMEREGDAHR